MNNLKRYIDMAVRKEIRMISDASSDPFNYNRLVTVSNHGLSFDLFIMSPIDDIKRSCNIIRNLIKEYNSRPETASRQANGKYASEEDKKLYKKVKTIFSNLNMTTAIIIDFCNDLTVSFKSKNNDAFRKTYAKFEELKPTWERSINSYIASLNKLNEIFPKERDHDRYYFNRITVFLKDILGYFKRMRPASKL